MIEPKYPGAFESIVNITACWDDNLLRASRERIVQLSKSCSRYHEHCCRFLSAAGSLTGDTYRAALECVNTAKLAGYCTRLTEREFRRRGGEPGKEKVRFLTAVTNKGVTSFTDTARALCQRIYLINDDYGAVSRLLLNAVRSAALAAGYDIISCYCPLSPFDKLEQLFVPEMELGFMTSNYFHDFSAEIDPYRIINCQRFSHREKLREHKKRILFNRKAASQMIGQAQALLQDAKSLHDELEGYYIHATDFDKVNALTDDVLRTIAGYRT